MNKLKTKNKMNKQTLEKLCKEYYSDIELAGSGNTDYGNFLIGQVYKQKNEEELEQRADIQEHIDFIIAVEKARINIYDEFAHRQIKEEFMEKYLGYKKLNGFNSLADCPANAIGSAFKNSYNSAMRKVKEYAGGGGR